MTSGRVEPFIVNHEDVRIQAYYGLIRQLPDFFADQKLSHTADVAAALIKARLVDTVREKLGLTYSPNASAASSIGSWRTWLSHGPDRDAARQVRGHACGGAWRRWRASPAIRSAMTN